MIIDHPHHADPTHVDAINNLGAALTSLAPADRTRLAKTTGLFQLPEEPTRASEGKSVDPDISEVDEVMADLFRQALELEPTHRWALINLGLHLHARSRNDEVRVRDQGTFWTIQGIEAVLSRGWRCCMLHPSATTLLVQLCLRWTHGC